MIAQGDTDSPGLKLAWVALTQGDPAGIGPEIILKAFALQPEDTRDCVVIGHLAVFERALKLLIKAHPDASELKALTLRRVTLDELRQTEDLLAYFRGEPCAVPFLDLSDETHCPSIEPALTHLKGNGPLDQSSLPLDDSLPRMGVVSAKAGDMAARSVVVATELHLQGIFKAVVTAPLHKESLSLAGWSFPGHTELLQAHAAWHMGVGVKDLPVRMMLASDALRVVLVSIHISLRQAIERVDFGGVLETVRIAHQALGSILGRKPKIALAGLNPHAGENGLMGQEEIEVLAPVVQKAKKLGIDVTGPIAPDTVFMRARSGGERESEFDAVIAMYHDQGLIPIKYMGLDSGVNVTLGLPLVRTSPDHGTAFDVAGTGQAREQSMVQAINFAKKMTLNRA